MTECEGLRKLIESEHVIKRAEDIDNKGVVVTYNIVNSTHVKEFETEVMLRFCPVCGKQICNVMVPEGECDVYEAPSDIPVAPYPLIDLPKEEKDE